MSTRGVQLDVREAYIANPWIGVSTQYAARTGSYAQRNHQTLAFLISGLNRLSHYSNF